MPRKGPTSRRWSFTLNNYDEEHIESLHGLIENEELSYIIMGREVGDSGTPHLQGYLELPRKKTLAGLKKLLAIHQVHLEVSKGSSKQNQDYCKKDGAWTESGTPMQQGKRKDLVEIKELMDKGATPDDIANTHFSKWVVYRKSFNAYYNIKMGSRTWKSRVVVLIGPTGYGKTRFVHDQPDARALWTWGGDRWFDGYMGHELALFDDFDGHGMDFRFLLRLLDRYPMQVPIKGGFVEWLPRKIYITSNLHPRHWQFQGGCGYDISPLLRRLDTIHELNKPLY